MLFAVVSFLLDRNNQKKTAADRMPRSIMDRSISWRSYVLVIAGIYAAGRLIIEFYLPRLNLTSVVFVFSVIGILYFFLIYKNVKEQASFFVGIFGCIFILYLLSLLWNLFVYDFATDFGEVYINVVVFVRNILLASVGSHLLMKQKLPVTPLLRNGHGIREQWKSCLAWSMGSATLMFLISTFLLFITAQPIAKASSYKFVDVITLAFHAVLVSISEETFVRLFLQALFIHLLAKAKFGTVVSLGLCSVIWAFSHAGIIETGGVKFIQIFVFGILLGILMLKKGWESCCFAHAMFNFAASILLPGFQTINN